MMTPLRYRVRRRLVETADTVTLVLDPVDEAIVAPLPGQFTMMYAFGVGEVPISVSGHVDGAIVHTIRDVGAVSGALAAAGEGEMLGIRGPYGTDWGVPAGGDLLYPDEYDKWRAAGLDVRVTVPGEAAKVPAGEGERT